MDDGVEMMGVLYGCLVILLRLFVNMKVSCCCWLVVVTTITCIELCFECIMEVKETFYDLSVVCGLHMPNGGATHPG